LKLFHYMMFMVNETRGSLSSLFECVHAHADLRARRTAPFPAQVAARIDVLIAEHRTLAWPAPVSGPWVLKHPPAREIHLGQREGNCDWTQ
jgi:acyl-CoA thioester hydrolase